MKNIFLILIFPLLYAGILVACEKNEQGDNGSNNDFVLPKLPDPDDVCSIMEDINFMRYCIENFDVNHDGKVSPHEAKAVFKILLNRPYEPPVSAKSLKGIEYFTNLTNLSCYKIGLTGCLDLRNNTSLETVACDSNEINSLLLGKVEMLETLSCHNNLITYLDIGQCICLKGSVYYKNPLEVLILPESQTGTSSDFSTAETFKIVASGLEVLNIRDYGEPSAKIVDVTQCPKLRRINGTQSTIVEKIYAKKGHVFEEDYGELIHYVD